MAMLLKLKNSRYRITKLIDKGGMGEVYKAFDNTLNRNVAIKKRLGRSKNLENKNHEAQLLASLNHPNIVQVYDSFTHKNSQYIVTELIEGKNLTFFLRKNATEMSTRLSWLLQITSAIHYTHQNNIIHGDIKLENVMLGPKGIVKLTDYGLGRYSDKDNSDSLIGGSFDYMAPETLKFNIVNKLTDYFSLGVLAYKLLCNVSPFGKANEELTQILSSRDVDLIPASQLNEHISTDLATMIEKLLQEEPDDRKLDLDDFTRAIRANLNRPFGLSFAKTEYGEATTKILPKYPGGESTKKAARIKRLSPIALVFLLLSFSMILLFYDKTDQSNSNIHLLILEPEIEANTHLSEEVANQLKLTIFESISSSVSNSTQLINVNQPNKSLNFLLPEKIRFTGAQEALRTQLTCRKNICDFKMSRISKNGTSIINLKQWSSPTASLTSLSTTTGQMLSSLYGNISIENANEFINESSYRRYLKLYFSMRIKKENLNNSIEELEGLILESPKFLPFYYLYRETALNLYQHSRDELHLTNLKRILNLGETYFPDSPEIISHQFWMAISRSDLESANRYLDKIKLLKNRLFLTLELSAYFYLENGDYKKANETYILLSEHRPSRKFFYNLALSYWYLGKYEKTLSNLQKVLKISPNDFSAMKLSATAYLTLGKIDLAQPLFESIAKTNASASNFSNLGLAYLISDQYTMATNSFKKALEIEPKNIEAIINMADTYKITGKIESSNELYFEALNILEQRQDWRSTMLKSQVFAQLGDTKKAIQILQSLQLKREANAEIYFTAALVYVLAGDMTSAMVNVENAYNNNYGKVWFHLPWFKKLCQREDFVKLISFSEENNSCGVS